MFHKRLEFVPSFDFHVVVAETRINNDVYARTATQLSKHRHQSDDCGNRTHQNLMRTRQQPYDFEKSSILPQIGTESVISLIVTFKLQFLVIST